MITTTSLYFHPMRLLTQATGTPETPSTFYQQTVETHFNTIIIAATRCDCVKYDPHYYYYYYHKSNESKTIYLRNANNHSSVSIGKCMQLYTSFTRNFKQCVLTTIRIFFLYIRIFFLYIPGSCPKVSHPCKQMCAGLRTVCISSHEYLCSCECDDCAHRCLTRTDQ